MTNEDFLKYKDNIKFHEDFYYYDVVRKNIRKYRRALDLTQQQFSELVNLSMHYFAQIETGKPRKFYSLSLLGKIADALGVPITKLFEE